MGASATVIWAGTNTAIAFACSCGAVGHIDGVIAGAIRCGSCGAAWELPEELEARRASPDAAIVVTTLPSKAVTVGAAPATDISHPGERLTALLAVHEMTAADAALRMKARGPYVERVAQQQAAITVDLAMRLERLFGESAMSWLTDQAAWDVSCAARDERMATIEPLAEAT